MNDDRTGDRSPWPAPADAAAAARLIERFHETGSDAAALTRTAHGHAMLAAIGGNSPFLSDLAFRDPETLCSFAAEGPDAVATRAMDHLRACSPKGRREEVSATLRRTRRVVALTAALADIGGLWPLTRFTALMTELAEAALDLALGHLLLAAQDAGLVRVRDVANPAEGSGFTIIGMGKLGARELNYSSDIDLILIYDPSAPIYTERTAGDALRGFTSRLARDLVTLMERRDAEGYVFRTDLRLRPDPAVTPPAVSLPAALTYYESMGQNWERAAMIKARPVAGDRETGAAFLEAIRPFVWRRGLDFAAVADIAALKRRIDTHRGVTDGLAGLNVKLGRGGIREIEFLVQTLQMVWGGRDPVLRDRATLGAMEALAAAGHLERDATDDLAAAYEFLRRVEHRLQMVADRQVHTLPEQPDEFARFSMFMGYATREAFAADLSGYLDRVRAHYAAVFGAITAEPSHPLSSMLDFRGDDPCPAGTVEALRQLGFQDPARIVSAVRGWQSGRIRAFRSQRARELLDHSLPAILTAFGRQNQPDAAFSRFDTFLSALPGGVQLMALFEHNPALIERLAGLLGAGPSLAEHLAHHPGALEGLLAPQPGPPDPATLLAARLRDARALEDVITIVRRTVREEDFAISAGTLEGRLDADEAGLRRTALADAALAALLDPARSDFAERYGEVPGGQMVVVALGKAGGKEMMAGSDLDLMLVYDHPAEVIESVGARPLSAPQYFLRLANAFVAALTAPGADGHLYDVDMRLRPSGNKGPVAVSLPAFRRYHAEDAWTWERMALTRARVIAGPAALRDEVESAIGEAIGAPVAAGRVRADAAAMRARLARDLPPHGFWDVKLRSGGQIEVEFIAQVLQLMHARDRPEVQATTTRVALQRLEQAGFLAQEEAARLAAADRLWRTIQGVLRIAIGRSVPEELPDATLAPVLRATGQLDAAALRGTVKTTAQEVRAAFTRIVGEVA